MVDESVVIDFHVPVEVTNTMQDVEDAYKKDGELGPFLNWVDTLDVLCKNCYAAGAITKKQWDKIMSRYPLE